ncbi:MAG: nicotinamide-nucleotide adenylyltransferase [Lachnospiraceae bacterium]|nr:nicotinamide-nucleotide adenylyltransferase [Lachnospiraceae bacterium]
MQYNVGMYGGSFDPLHIGHIDMIIKAAAMCKKLYIVLSFSRKRDSVPMEIRYRWIKNSFKHMDNIEIILLEDNANSKDEYDKGSSCGTRIANDNVNTNIIDSGIDSYFYWEQGRDYVLETIGSPIDVVFCGSDYKGTNRYEELYKCEVIYVDRDIVSVSSTKIRSNPFKYWDYIPKICRSYYTKKILIIGGESTGKTTLTQNLALHYNTNFLEEVGREVCENAGAEELMVVEDFYEILLRHKTKELEVIKDSNKLLFIDTDALTTKFYINFLLDKNKNNGKALADAIANINTFDLIFFLEPTVKFVQDGTRSEVIKEDREKYSIQIKKLFEEHGLDFISVTGDYEERYTSVINKIKECYNI